MSNRVPRDRLSNLPLSIIHEILARVPIKEAIRTALLSNQWRHTWTTLPHLNFYTCGSRKKDDRKLNEDFVSNALLRHEGPIHRFEVSCLHISSIDTVEDWILCLSRKDIRDLNIEMNSHTDDHVNELKSGIYSCVNLTKLRLQAFGEINGVRLPPPPSSFTGFLALKSLDLHGIEIPNRVQSLIDCCPLLETLEIDDYSCSELSIRSQNLMKLSLGGYYEKLCLCASVLAELYLGFEEECPGLVCNYEFFGCFTNLVELSVAGYYIKNLSSGIDSCHHLRVIDLSRMNFADKKVRSNIARLIVAAPNLHKLGISICTFGYEEDPDLPFEDIGCEPNFTLGKLRDVRLDGVLSDDSPFCMHLIKFLLERSTALETIKIDCLGRKMLAKLLGFRRSSPNARILVHGW